MSANPSIRCPRCDFEAPGGDECPRCGIVFDRYRGPEAARPQGLYARLPEEPPPRASEEDRRINRGSWLLLFLMVCTVAVWSEIRPDEPVALPVLGQGSGELPEAMLRESDAGVPVEPGVEPPEALLLDRFGEYLAVETAPPAPLSDRTIWGDGWLEEATGFEVALRDAARDDRVVFLYVYTDWCPYCREIERNVLEDPTVRECLAYSVKVKVNPENGPAEAAIAKWLGVTGYPTLLFVDPRTGAAQRAPRSYTHGGALLSACRREIT